MHYAVALSSTLHTLLRCPFNPTGTSCTETRTAQILSKSAVSSHIHELLRFKVHLGFQQGPFNLKPKKGKSMFFLSLLVKVEKERRLDAFVFGPSSAESIKPAHQLGHATSYSPWIIKSYPSTRSCRGQDRAARHLRTTAGQLKTSEHGTVIYLYLQTIASQTTIFIIKIKWCC